MSKKKDIVNEIQGSIGDFVIYKRYGKTFLRSRPKTMNHPNSDAQLEQRHKFSMSNTLAKNYRAAVGHVSVETDEPKSPYNSMIGIIRRTGFKGKYPEISWNWEAIEFSEGSLALPSDLKMNETDSHIHLEWNSAETKELGTVFLIGVNPETLKISVSTDANNSGSLSLEKSEGHQYFAFKEWINEEKTLKSSTKRYLQNSELADIPSEISSTNDRPIALEEKEILAESDGNLDDEMESVRGLDDETIEISFDPSEFGDFSSDNQNEETEMESETDPDEVIVGTLGIVEPEIVYNPQEFTGFEKLESNEIKEDTIDNSIEETPSEDLVELDLDAILETETDFIPEIESELETVEESVVESDVVILDESSNEEEIIDESLVVETAEIIEETLVEARVEEEKVEVEEAQELIEDVVQPEPEVIKEETVPVQKVEKEKNAKKTLVEKAITSKEDEMRNQLSLF